MDSYSVCIWPIRRHPNQLEVVNEWVPVTRKVLKQKIALNTSKVSNEWARWLRIIKRGEFIYERSFLTEEMDFIGKLDDNLFIYKWKNASENLAFTSLLLCLECWIAFLESQPFFRDPFHLELNSIYVFDLRNIFVHTNELSNLC